MESLNHNIHKELIEKCKSGDSKAQFEIYKLYYYNMYNISLRIVNDSAEAEDIMQNAFLTAFEKLNTYRGEVSFGSWLKRIVVNKSIDYIRKKKIQFVEISATTEKADEESSDEIDTTLTIDQIKSTIQELPEGYRLVLTLHLIEEYNYDEIAKVLNIKESTVRSQYVRAKEKLKEKLQKLIDQNKQ